VPPHTIISVPVQTAVCAYRPSGAPSEDMGHHVPGAGVHSTSGSPVLGSGAGGKGAPLGTQPPPPTSRTSAPNAAL
jgi:hypothetical protein